MKKRNQVNIFIGPALLAAFVLWTVAVRFVDVKAIGPDGSSVGFAALNGAFHDAVGVHMSLYKLTDVLGYIPLLIVAGFAALGVWQLIKRKNLAKVDSDIYALGGFYVMVIAVYAIFEVFAVNYRPVMIDGALEASYPSSHTMLALCIIPTAMMQLKERIKNDALRKAVLAALAVLAAFLLIGRLLSGVHWLTDIIGGVLVSAGLVMLYASVCDILKGSSSPYAHRF